MKFYKTRKSVHPTHCYFIVTSLIQSKIYSYLIFSEIGNYFEWNFWTRFFMNACSFYSKPLICLLLYLHSIWYMYQKFISMYIYKYLHTYVGSRTSISLRCYKYVCMSIENRPHDMLIYCHFMYISTYKLFVQYTHISVYHIWQHVLHATFN